MYSWKLQFYGRLKLREMDVGIQVDLHRMPFADGERGWPVEASPHQLLPGLAGLRCQRLAVQIESVAVEVASRTQLRKGSQRAQRYRGRDRGGEVVVDLVL